MSRTVALLPYPPSAGLREQLEAELGEAPEYVNLAEIGRLRSFQTVVSLRKYKGRPAVVVVEDEASISAIPVLHAVAAVAGASRVELFQPAVGRRRLRLR
jgi:hypothetical protein